MGLREPAEELGIEVADGANLYMVTHTMGSYTLGTNDPFRMNLMIGDKTDAKVLATYGDSPEMMVAHQVDGRFDGVDPEGAASLECA